MSSDNRGLNATLEKYSSERRKERASQGIIAPSEILVVAL